MLPLNVLQEGYTRNASCALNLTSSYLLLSIVTKMIFVFGSIVTKMIFVFGSIVTKMIFVFGSIVTKMIFVFGSIVTKMIFVFGSIVTKMIFVFGSIVKIMIFVFGHDSILYKCNVLLRNASCALNLTSSYLLLIHCNYIKHNLLDYTDKRLNCATLINFNSTLHLYRILS
jgi:hypothetical protein